MPRVLRPDDANLRWHGAVSVEKTGEWLMPWRIPYGERDLFDQGLVVHAGAPAGVRLAFRSEVTSVSGRVEPVPDAAKLDLCCDGALVGSVELAGREEFCFDGLPSGGKAVELWLPQVGSFRLKSLELSDGATAEPFEDPRPRWITYGSSISQCAAAESPTQTWPAIVARERGLNLTCLGFGGQCHLDTSIARMMRDLPADFISMCVGINIYGSGSMNARTFRPSIIGFVQILRERHADTPIVVMSPILSPPNETRPNAVGFTLRAMRDEVAAAVEALRAHGDPNTHYVDGVQVFGPDLAHLLPDGVHPDAEGYRLMGRNFLQEVIARIFP